ncbi:YceI family protein [Paenibacillus sp. KS-LC4]|uniref:YceI family protein n=1 Tax=Paenibacillus sp. KS-LC4 TaxID=2979727 RepID=UPI0030CBB87A
MKKRNVVIGAVAAVVLLGGAGAYAMYDSFTGNNKEIKSVIGTESTAASSASGTNSADSSSTNSTNGTETAAAAGAVADVNGVWTIDSTSNVYFSVTTSRETVNFEVNGVTGTWNVDTADAAANAADASLDMNVLDSGNGQRDGHVKEADFLDVANFPSSTFKATKFEALPAEVKDGETFPLIMTGDLTIKGITKEVTFTGQAAYSGGKLNVESETVVTFEEFGMKNPHNVVMDTENDVTVQLRLTLSQSA